MDKIPVFLPRLTGSVMALCSNLAGLERFDAPERRRLALLQFYNLVSMIMMVFFAGLFFVVDASRLYLPALVSLACIPLYALGFLGNRRGWHGLAKPLFFFTLSGSILLSTTFLLGRAPGMHFFFLMAAVLPLLIWDMERPAWIIFFMVMNLGSFLWIEFRIEPIRLWAGPFPAEWQGFYNWMSVVASYSVTLIILIFYQRRADLDARALEGKARQMESLMHQYEDLSNTDPLTGLDNRRAMLVRLETERERMRRSKTVFAILLADIDQFKSLNDTRGHAAGDAVLTSLGTVFKGSLREVDRVARWGGDEFLILLPDTGLDGALHAAEMLRQKVAAAAIPWEGQVLSVSLTIGLAVHDPLQDDLTVTFRRADAALYRGKQGGRNQVITARESD